MSDRERLVIAQFNRRSKMMLTVMLFVIALYVGTNVSTSAPSMPERWAGQAICLAVIAFGLWIWRRGDVRRLEAELMLAAARDRAVVLARD